MSEVSERARRLVRSFKAADRIAWMLFGPMLSSGLFQTRKRNVAVASFAALCIVATLLVTAFRTDVTTSLAVFQGLFSYHSVDEWPGMCKSGHGQVRLFMPLARPSFVSVPLRNP